MLIWLYYWRVESFPERCCDLILVLVNAFAQGALYAPVSVIDNRNAAQLLQQGRIPRADCPRLWLKILWRCWNRHSGLWPSRKFAAAERICHRWLLDDQRRPLLALRLLGGMSGILAWPLLQGCTDA